MEVTMAAELKKLTLGPWPMNSYIVTCSETNVCAIIDPGADSERILKSIGSNRVEAILLTHGHADHVGALEEIKSSTSAPVCINPLDAEHFKLEYDKSIHDGDSIFIGNLEIIAVHTPGHTPGQTSFDLRDGRIIVGDTIFVGGPGRTWSTRDFKTTMKTMQDIVFNWPNETEFFPGHGPSGKIGIERTSFMLFVEKGWQENLYGDVTWSGK